MKRIFCDKCNKDNNLTSGYIKIKKPGENKEIRHDLCQDCISEVITDLELERTETEECYYHIPGVTKYNIEEVNKLNKTNFSIV